MQFDRITKDTLFIGLDAGYTADDWNILDANCLLEVREAFGIHTYEDITKKGMWVAAYKKLRGHGKSIIMAEISCVDKITLEIYQAKEAVKSN